MQCISIKTKRQMRNLKFIIAAVLLGTMASCSEDSMEIPEEPATVKFTDTYKGQYVSSVYSFYIDSTIEVERVSNSYGCYFIKDIVVTLDEGNHLVFYGYSEDGSYRYVFDIWVLATPDAQGNPRGKATIDSKEYKFNVGNLTCN